VSFQTGPRLAKAMLQRALEWGVPASWVTGDEVYDSHRPLRLWLEQQEVPHVLAIKSDEPLWLGTDRGPVQARAAQVPLADRVRLSAGTEPRGLGCMIGPECPFLPGKRLAKAAGAPQHRQLDELAYHVCFGEAETTLEGRVRVAGTRWAIEESFEKAKGKVGLGQYQVRRWVGWHRHITLVLLAQAFLVVTRCQAANHSGT
jgi:SRSO17 transposase